MDDAAKIELVAPLADSRWDSWLDRFPDANCFHTSAWLRVVENSYGHHATGFVLRTGADISGMVPVVVARSPWLGRRAACVAFADFSPPLAADLASFRLICDTIVQHGSAHRWRSVELRGGRHWLPAAPAATEFWQHELDLAPGESQLFAKLDSATRRNVRKAETEGVRVEISKTPAALEHYYALHCMTRRRLGSPPQPLRFFRSVWENLLARGNGFVALAWFGRIPVAGVVILTHATQAIYKFGASDERYQHLRPSNLAMWAAIKHCVALGFRSYHFGRTSRHDAGLRRYKLSWGCTERLLEYFCIDLRSGAFVRKPDRAGGWYSRVIRQLPTPVVRQVGEVLYRHLI